MMLFLPLERIANLILAPRRSARLTPRRHGTMADKPGPRVIVKLHVATRDWPFRDHPTHEREPRATPLAQHLVARYPYLQLITPRIGRRPIYTVPHGMVAHARTVTTARTWPACPDRPFAAATGGRVRTTTSCARRRRGKVVAFACARKAGRRDSFARFGCERGEHSKQHIAR